MSKTRMYIDFNKVENNINYLKGNEQVCLIVKAQMYGVDYQHINEFIQRGYNYFGVSTFEEALIIREINKDVKILILAPVEDDELMICQQLSLEITVVTLEQMRKVSKLNLVHLKFDTGMGRIGFTNNDVSEIKDLIDRRNNNVIGIYSHFACADDDEITMNQINKFKKILDEFDNYPFKYVHIQNTLGSIKYHIDFVNLKRIGIGTWGYLSNHKENKEYGKKLEPALSLYASVTQLKEYKGPIGYGHQDIVDGKIATLKIGYHDGLFRSAKGFEFQNGSKIVGNVCMCQTMVQVKEEITEQEIFGPNESIYNLCEYQQTITYEILVSISSRIKKIIIGSINEK